MTVRILKNRRQRAQCSLVFHIRGRGRLRPKIIGAAYPGGMEMMDKPAIHASEDFVLPAIRSTSKRCLLSSSMDESEVDDLLDRVAKIARIAGRRSYALRTPGRARKVLGRSQGGFPRSWAYFSRLLCMDGTIPRAKLPFVLARMRELSDATNCVSPRLPCRDGNCTRSYCIRNKSDELGARRNSAPIF